VGNYLESQAATLTLAESLDDAIEPEISMATAKQPRSRRIRVRTARNWLKKMGFIYINVRKGVFIDGHERPDVIAYRNTFINQFKELSKRFVIFHEDGTWEKPDLPPGQKPLVFITHDESTFNANDGKRRIWAENGKQPLRPKSKGKGIMVSAFLTPGGILKIPDNISNAELLANPLWPKDEAGNPEREAIRYLEYGKDNYWTGEKMVRHTKDVIPFVRYAFPGCEGLFAFDNASNHCVFAPDALVATKMNLGYGGSNLL